MRVIGLILVFASIVVASGANASFMIDFVSLMMVLGNTIGALLFAGASIPSMLKALFSSELGEEVKHQAIRGWKLAAGFSLAMGASATLIGLVLMLANMDDPAAIGPGFAIANLTSLYALIIALAISFPMYKSLERSS